MRFQESNIDWTFEDGWSVMRYDASSWYRAHFQVCVSSAAMDFIAVSPDGAVAWLVEVKDFTTEAPKKEKGDLWEIVSKKARDTLAGVLAGSVNCNVDEERALFQRIARAQTLRVAFHCEGPIHRSRLNSSLPDPADLRDKLRRALRAVDNRAIVVDCDRSGALSLPWTVRWRPSDEPRR